MSNEECRGLLFGVLILENENANRSPVTIAEAIPKNRNKTRTTDEYVQLKKCVWYVNV